MKVNTNKNRSPANTLKKSVLIINTASINFYIFLVVAASINAKNKHYHAEPVMNVIFSAPEKLHVLQEPESSLHPPLM